MIYAWSYIAITSAMETIHYSNSQTLKINYKEIEINYFCPKLSVLHLKVKKQCFLSDKN